MATLRSRCQAKLKIGGSAKKLAKPQLAKVLKRLNTPDMAIEIITK